MIVRGPDLLNPGDDGLGTNRDAMGMKPRLGEVCGSGRIADGHVNVPPVGGGDETAVGPGRPGDSGEGATSAKLDDRLPGACLECSVVAEGFVAELVDTAEKRTRGSLGRTERMKEWVEETADGSVPHGVVAMDVEKLAARAVKAVEE